VLFRLRRALRARPDDQARFLERGCISSLHSQGKTLGTGSSDLLEIDRSDGKASCSEGVDRHRNGGIRDARPVNPPITASGPIRQLLSSALNLVSPTPLLPKGALLSSMVLRWRLNRVASWNFRWSHLATLLKISRRSFREQGLLPVVIRISAELRTDVFSPNCCCGTEVAKW